MSFNFELSVPGKMMVDKKNFDWISFFVMNLKSAFHYKQTRIKIVLLHILLVGVVLQEEPRGKHMA
jgi:hypothetical protein